MKATPFASAVAADVPVRDGRLAMARRNLHVPYVELLACNGLSTLVGDGDYDLVEGKRTEGGLRLLRELLTDKTVANSRVKSTV